jgi:uncharacterized protein (TIGR02646 family)
MISIHRPSRKKEFSAANSKYKQAKQKLDHYFKTSSAKRSQTRYSLEQIKEEIFFLTENFLAPDFNLKCCYCEIHLPEEGPQNIELFRPMSSAHGFDKTDFSPDHYWWLALEWNNILYACPECIKSKGNWFPVKGKRASLLATGAELAKENNLLLDPCSKKVESHFSYNSRGYIFPTTDRGETTVELLKLNRVKLIKKRKLEIEKTRIEFNKFKALFKQLGKLNIKQAALFEELTTNFITLYRDVSFIEFTGLKRYMLRQWFFGDTNPTIKKFIYVGTIPSRFNKKQKDSLTQLFNCFYRGSDGKQIKLSQAPKRKKVSGTTKLQTKKDFFISRIEIQNVKSIAKLTYEIAHNPTKTPWLLLLGENGVGKSSSLQAIAMALAGQKYWEERIHKDREKFIRQGSRFAAVKIFFEGEVKPLHIRFTNRTFSIVSKPLKFRFPPTTLLGYGSTRLLPEGELKWEEDFKESQVGAAAVRVRNMFYPSTALYNSEEWLLKLHKLNRRDFDFAALAIKSLVDFDTQIDLFNKSEEAIKLKKKISSTGLRLIKALDENKKQRIYIQRDKQRFLIEQLSDGYQSVIALSVDIMRSLFTLDTDMNNANAIIMVDEIGTHLHPRWRMRVVNSLRMAFPRVQFIVTTHDPLCLKGLENKEVSVLRSDEKGQVKLLNNLPDPSLFRADQLLTSEFFGLSSTIDPDTERDFNQLYYLKSLPPAQLKKIDGGQLLMNRLEAKLRIQQSDSRHLGDSLREELVYHVIDELLAKKFRQVKDITRTDLKSEAVKRVGQLWTQLEKETTK